MVRGPVDDLGAHVADDWWKTLFGETYLLTDADVLGEQNTRAEVEALIDALGLAPKARILDLCCGQGRHALEMARRGFTRVSGLDQSAYLIGEARAAAQSRGLDVDFQEGDARELPFEDGAFDAVVLMGNSFGYFAAEQDDAAALREVRRVLEKKGGRVLLDLTDGAYLRARYEARSWEWIDETHLACRERTLDGDRLVTREVVVHTGKGVTADQFYAERLYDRSEISALLRRAGFTDVRVADAPETASDQGQDLGMMARRLFASARAGRASTSASPNGAAEGTRRNDRAPAAKQRLRVPVLLGDPRLPDETKLGGVFDEDDFEVVERLKDALATLESYAFSYHDDHATLEEELRAMCGEADHGAGNSLVFNLCDEGLRNDARREMHVPALLEMIGLPYTGAGPQCLAACYDKSLVRGVAREVGVPVAEGRYLDPGAPTPEALDLNFPVIVKPNTGDNSKGITQDSVAQDVRDLPRAVAAVRAQVGLERALLIEAFLPGKDLTVGLLGNAGEDLAVLPIVAENYAHLPEGLPRLCGYEAKWLPDSPYWMGNADAARADDLPAQTCAALEQGSRRLFTRLGCRDYARLDWRLDAEGQPHLLEVNPNPGWCWDGHLAAQAAFAGTDYAGLLERILRAAWQRVRSSVEV